MGLDELETCGTCGVTAYAYPRCRECGALDIGYLQDRVRDEIRADALELAKAMNTTVMRKRMG